VTGGCLFICGFFAQWQTQNFAVVASTGSAATPPSAPTLDTPTVADRSVTLTWSVPSSNGGATITGYAVYRATSSGTEAAAPLANTGALTYTDTAVTNNVTYYYKVAAINSAGTGTLSNEVSATPTAPPPPPNFTVVVTPPSQTISRGSLTTYTVTVTPTNGFTGTVTLKSSISPSGNGLTMTFNPASVAPGTSSTLTVGTARKTAKHTYTITITGTSGALVHSVTVTLILQ
jgi:fibronectin type 3 domain-containing protein